MIFFKESFRGFLDLVWNRSTDGFPGHVRISRIAGRCIFRQFKLVALYALGGHLKVFMPLSKSEYELLSGSSQK